MTQNERRPSASKHTILAGLNNSVTTITQYLHSANQLYPHVVSLQFFSELIRALNGVLRVWFFGTVVDMVISRTQSGRIMLTLLSFLSAIAALEIASSLLQTVTNSRDHQLNVRADRDMTSRLLQSDFQTFMNPVFRKLYSAAKTGFEYTGGLELFMRTLIGQMMNLILTLILSGSTVITILSLSSSHPASNELSHSPWYYAALIVLLAVPLIASLLFSHRSGTIMQRFFAFNMAFNRKLDYTMRILFRNTTAAMIMRIYDPKDTIIHDTEGVIHSQVAGDQRFQVRAAVWQSMTGVVTAAIVGLLYVLIALKSYAGDISIGQVVACVGYLQLIITAMAYMLSAWGNRTASLTSIDQYIAFMTWKAPNSGHLVMQDHDNPKTRPQAALAAALTSDDFTFVLDHVSFTYPSVHTRALHDVCMTIHSRQRIAIVGRNGSGKTTLIKLITRLLEPTEGRILLNGVDIMQYDLESYQRLFSPVFQNFTLVAGTIQENITGLCNPTPPIAAVPSESFPSAHQNEERFAHALDVAGLDTFINRLPQHERTHITNILDPTGINPSGGEAQKIAIARAVYRNSPVIVLDEPTAALDPRAETEIYERFDEMIGTKTAIYISHRMSSTKFSDCIIVMDHGSIAQTGTHDTLMQTDGIYQQLFNAQAAYYKG